MDYFRQFHTVLLPGTVVGTLAIGGVPRYVPLFLGNDFTPPPCVIVI